MIGETVVTVGSFDGVHRGHWRILQEIAERAHRTGRRSLLVTFEPHPLEVVNPQAAPLLLTLSDERREVLAQSDLDAVAFMPFTRVLSNYTPEAFVRLLLERFQMAELVIGHDHGFGRHRSGDEHVVQDLGEKLGFGVDVVAPVEVDGRVVSSTLIRRAVAGGDLDTARQQLGRSYAIAGTVVRGAGRGRTLGYRTINLAPPDSRKLLPPDGVYAVRVEWRDGSSGGMMHMGARPTFGDVERSLEVHLLDGAPDLYGQLVKISWVARLRDVMSFPSPAALTAQLDRDFAAAQSVLAVPPAGPPG
ncbi:MAG TPA: riboflavin biosynthesis protein RibF [Gemmatimonadales bacterium]|nr:riboflavin biosynthesis protein RibF [Gemmatimonadales bacterium]